MNATPVEHSFLAMLPSAQAARLIESGARRTYAADEPLIRESEAPLHVQVILDGWVRVSATGAQGDEVLFALRGPGDVVGESGVLLNAPRRATVRAIEPVTAVRIPGPRFLEIVTDWPGAALALARGMAMRLDESDTIRADIANLDVTRRVAGHLLRLVRAHGVRRGEGVGIDLPLTQQDLASTLGASLRQVSRSMSVLRERGVVITGRKRITVARLRVLTALADPGHAG